MAAKKNRTRVRNGLPAEERRAPSSEVGSLTWLKGLLGRPLALERRSDGLHVVLVERRRQSPLDPEAQPLPVLCDALREQLKAYAAKNTTKLRLLVGLHNSLSRHGWDAVARKDSRVLASVLAQMKILLVCQPTPELKFIAHRLRMLQAAAEAREEQPKTQRLPVLRREVVHVKPAEDALVVVDVGENAQYVVLRGRAWDDTSAPASSSFGVDAPAPTGPGRA